MMKLTFSIYALGSIASMIALLMFAIITHESFYSILLFLSNARISTAVRDIIIE